MLSPHSGYGCRQVTDGPRQMMNINQGHSPHIVLRSYFHIDIWICVSTPPTLLFHNETFDFIGHDDGDVSSSNTHWQCISLELLPTVSHWHILYTAAVRENKCSHHILCTLTVLCTMGFIKNMVSFGELGKHVWNEVLDRHTDLDFRGI